MATQNYHSIKNAALITPATATDLGSVAQPYGNLYLQGNVTLGSTTITATSSIVPKITSLSYPGVATAADPAGGQTITINGTGFLSGISAYIANTVLGATNLISSTQVTFTAPAKTAGSYTLSVTNTDGGSASYVGGISYSALPVWSTSAGSLGTADSGTTISTITLAATENAQTITYAVTSGTLPSGLTLNSNGNITGTLSGSATTYNFTVTATDPQGQTATRNFSYAVTVAFMSATGGTITTDGNYKVHTFTTSSTLTVSGSGSVDYLVIAGGGAGGASQPGYNTVGGGGGAGGYLESTATLTNQVYTITVGSGAGASSNYNSGGNGSNSVISGSGFTSITAIGGGGGTHAYNGAGGTGSAGGSGGGSLGGYSGGAGTPGQGYAGGNQSGLNQDDTAGAGGGAGGVGGRGVQYGRAGGLGVYSSITGSSIARAGGGGGGGTSNGGGGGVGGSGGGTGGGGAYGSGTSGEPNTGGGGGGSGPANGGNGGGSGVVIIRYQFQ